MGTLWFTSDSHFMHDFLAMDIRGFSTTQEHDKQLIANYNSKIRPDDTVFTIGDFSLKKPDVFAPILQRLNGNWHLISGNHDACWPGHSEGYKFQQAYMDAGFKSVQPFGRRKLDGSNVLMSHFPYGGDHTGTDRSTQYRLREEGLVVLHGHTHEDKVVSWYLNGRGAFGKGSTLQVHVGLDAWKLMPVSVDQVIELIRLNKR